MDSAGRLLIAPVLRQHAGLTKEVMLVGQFNKFELWDETTWYQRVKEDIDAEQSDSGEHYRSGCRTCLYKYDGKL